jgi:hypothetical protein
MYWNETGFKVKFIQGQEIWYGQFNGDTNTGHQHSGELLWHERTKQRMKDFLERPGVKFLIARMTKEEQDETSRKLAEMKAKQMEEQRKLDEEKIKLAQEQRALEDENLKSEQNGAQASNCVDDKIPFGN